MASIVKELDKLSGTKVRSHNITDALKKLGAGPSKNIADAVSRVEVGGSGSSSNIVYGSFTTQGEKGVQNIDVPYSGKGYPIEVIIYPSDSYGFAAKSESSLSDMTGKNGIIVWQGFKMSSKEAPVYGQNHGTANEMTTIVALKEYYSDSTTDRFQTSESCYPFSYAEASEPANKGDGWEPYLDNTVVVLTETGISIFVRGDDAGFFQNTEYAYRIIYSDDSGNDDSEPAT